jgi:hypothetical protein
LLEGEEFFLVLEAIAGSYLYNVDGLDGGLAAKLGAERGTCSARAVSLASRWALSMIIEVNMLI